MITIDDVKSEAGRYLGDGAYAVKKHGLLWITTSDGLKITRPVALSPYEFKTLLAFAIEDGFIKEE